MSAVTELAARVDELAREVDELRDRPEDTIGTTNTYLIKPAGGPTTFQELFTDATWSQQFAYPNADPRPFVTPTPEGLKWTSTQAGVFDFIYTGYRDENGEGRVIGAAQQLRVHRTEKQLTSIGIFHRWASLTGYIIARYRKGAEEFSKLEEVRHAGVDLVKQSVGIFNYANFRLVAGFMPGQRFVRLALNDPLKVRANFGLTGPGWLQLTSETGSSTGSNNIENERGNGQDAAGINEFLSSGTDQGFRIENPSLGDLVREYEVQPLCTR